MNFLKRVLSTLVGLILFFLIGGFFLMIIGIALGGASKPEVKVDNNSILQIQLNFPVKDYEGRISYKDFTFLNQKNQKGLYKLVNAIDYAATDKRIEGISIELPAAQAGISQLKAIRDALIRFKASGKFITAYADVYSQKDYYLSSVADSVYLNPVGMLDFKGLGSQILYFKDFEDKSGIKMDVVRMGKYKSAVEPFLTNKISDANREQVLSYLNSLWQSLRLEIGKSRDISPAQLDTIADNLSARTAERAKKVGLVDQLVYKKDYEDLLKSKLNTPEDEDLNSISLASYTQAIGTQKHYQSNTNKLAVIYAQGNIIYGQGSVDKIGPYEIANALHKVAQDSSIKAIVLRVNSPGGSALSSDLIWKAVEEAKTQKPVIVSMGDFAASGGYYISSGADHIFAENTTITGSIGVFGMLPNIKGLADKIGINAEQVSTNKHAISYSIFEGLTPEQHDLILESIQETYNLFKKRVSIGRSISMDSVQSIAQGRVWTGEQAVKIGLVDEIGGLDDALAYAAHQSGLEDYQLVEYPIYHIDLNEVLSQYGLGMTKSELLKETLGKELYPLYKDFKHKTEAEGVQLLFPYSTVIR